MKHKIFLKATLLLSCIYAMAQTSITVPILGDVAREFPAAGNWISQLVSLTALMIIPSSIVAGKLAEYISKKKIVIFGTLLFLLSGLGGMLVNDIMTLVVLRCLVGIGAGCVYSLAPAMIAHLFEGQERVQMMGWENACGGFFAFALSMVTGYVALVNWKYTFLLYLIFVPILLFQGVFLPNFPPEKTDTSIIEKSAEKIKMGLPAWVIDLHGDIYGHCHGSDFKTSSFYYGRKYWELC